MATATKSGRSWTAYWEGILTTSGSRPPKAATLYGQEGAKFLHAGGSTAERERGGFTWAAVWEIGRDANDVPVTVKHGGFATQQEAVTFAQGQRENIRSGSYVPLEKLTVHGYLEAWLTDYATPNTRARTVHGYRGILTRYVLPALGDVGDVELQQLSFDHIQGLYSILIGRVLSPQTVLHTHRVLKKTLQWAVKARKLTRNTADDVTPPRASRKELTILRPADVDRLLTAVEDTDFGPVVLVALYTTLRRSELCGLRWCDTNLDTATLSLIQTVQRVPGIGLVPQATKSHRSRRRVSLSSETVTMLRRVRSAQMEQCLAAGVPWQDTLPVFGVMEARDGVLVVRPIAPDFVSQKFHRLIRKPGVTGLRFHDLRHAHASYMLAQGVHPRIVAERLGHADVSTTLNVYSHILPGLQEQAAQDFEATIQKARLTRGG